MSGTLRTARRGAGRRAVEVFLENFYDRRNIFHAVSLVAPQDRVQEGHIRECLSEVIR